MADNDHPLIEPRVVATVGLIALGAGLGIGLMLARTLIAVGYGLSLACACGVIWLYWTHLKSAYRALMGRGRYKGPHAPELLISLAMAIVLVSIATAVFPIVLTNTPSPNRAQLQLATFSRFSYPDRAQPSVNIQISNSGNLNANKVTMAISVRLVEGATLDKQQIDDQLSGLLQFVRARDSKKLYNYRQMTPSGSSIVTLQDIRPDKLRELIDGANFQIPELEFSDQKWADFQKGHLTLYVFFSAHYEDENMSGEYWETSFCGFFTVTPTYWHNCAANQIIRVSGKR